jgi:hypothetical protein
MPVFHGYAVTVKCYLIEPLNLTMDDIFFEIYRCFLASSMLGILWVFIYYSCFLSLPIMTESADSCLGFIPCIFSSFGEVPGTAARKNNRLVRLERVDWRESDAYCSFVGIMYITVSWATGTSSSIESIRNTGR